MRKDDQNTLNNVSNIFSCSNERASKKKLVQNEVSFSPSAPRKIPIQHFKTELENHYEEVASRTAGHSLLRSSGSNQEQNSKLTRASNESSNEINSHLGEQQRTTNSQNPCQSNKMEVEIQEKLKSISFSALGETKSSSNSSRQSENAFAKDLVNSNKNKIQIVQEGDDIRISIDDGNIEILTNRLNDRKIISLSPQVSKKVLNKNNQQEKPKISSSNESKPEKPNSKKEKFSRVRPLDSLAHSLAKKLLGPDRLGPIKS